MFGSSHPLRVWRPQRAVTLLAAAVLTLGLAPARAAPPEASPDDPSAKAHRWTPTPFTAEASAVLAASKAIPAGEAPVTWLLDDQREHLRQDGSRTTRLVRVVRVDSPRGVEAVSSVSGRWQPAYETQPTIRARVITPEGTVHALDPSQLTIGAAGATGPSQFTDAREMAAPLPRVTVGAVIETERVYTQHTPRFSVGHHVDFGLTSSVSPLHQVLEVTVDPGLALTAAIRGADLEPTIEVVDGNTVWRVDVAPPPKAPARWAGALLDAVEAPRVVIDTTPTWAAAAQAYHAVLEPIFAVAGPQIASLIEGLPRAGEPGGDARAAAHALSRRIADRTRYTGVHFGAAAIVPRAPADVLRDGFGDCKDLAVLYVAALRELGHSADVVLLRANGPALVSEVPGLGAFDHAIARVGTDPPMWVDLTVSEQRAGLIMPWLVDRRVLVIHPETTGVTRLPRPDPSGNGVKIRRVYRMPPHGAPSPVEVEESLSGTSAMFRRRLLIQRSPQLEQVLTAGREGLTEVETTPPEDPRAETLTFRQTMKDSRAAAWVDLAQVPVDTALFFRWLPNAATAPLDAPLPTGPVSIYAAHTIDLTVRVELPPGYDRPKMDQAATRQLGPSTLKMTYTAEPWPDASMGVRVFEVRYAFESGPAVWSPDDIKAFRAAAHPLYQSEGGEPLSFPHRGHAAIAAGRIGEGLAIYRALARSGGLDAELDYLSELSDYGFTGFARARAKALTEAHPKNPRTWALLGASLASGASGDLLTAGAQAKEALPALEQAFELDPENEALRSLLTMVLAMKTINSFHTDRDRLTRALKIGRSVKDLAPLTMGIALLLGQAESAVEIGRAQARLDSDSLSVLLAAIAVAESPEAAMAEARTRAPDDRARLQALKKAVFNLGEVQLYPVAKAMADRVGDAGFTPEARERFGETVPFAEATLDPDDPETPVRRLLYALITQQPPARWGGFATKGLQDQAGEALLALMDADIKGKASLADAPRANLGNFIALHANLDVDRGADGRPTLINAGLAGRQVTFVVEPRARSPRVMAASGFGPALFGREVVRAVARGDEEGAQRWRTWSMNGLGRSHWGRTNPFGHAHCLASKTWDHPIQLSAAALLSSGTAADRRQAARFIEAHGGDPDGPLSAFGRCVDNIRWSLAYAARDADALARIAGRYPEDPLLASNHVAIVLKWEGPEAAQAALDRLSPKLRAEPWLIGREAAILGRRGQHAAALEAHRATVEALDTDASALNNAAWAALFVDAPLEPAIAHARRAVELRGHDAERHTLAALLAAAEHPEARTRFAEVVSSRPPIDEDWLVVGLLAEQYGLTEVARHAYGALAETEVDVAELAQRRLEALPPAE